MIPSDRRPGIESTAAGDDADSRPTRGTLPPPEWTATQEGVAHTSVAPKGLERRGGLRAEEAWMRARVEEARAEKDRIATREACAALARWLASRDRDLDEAVDLALEALKVGDDLELRRELASWLESLGELARAAGALKVIAAMPDVDGGEASYVLVRSGVLKARAGAAAGGAAAFEAAMPIAPEDPLPPELLGALADWEPGAVSPGDAAEAYVEAARRRAAQGDDEAELEDLWRAFSLDATNGRAAQALAFALEQRGKYDSADEVWRAHARDVAAKDIERAAVVHMARRTTAAAAHEHSRALGAALDARLDGCFYGSESDAFDGILVDLGLHEVLAARLVLRASNGPPTERAVHLADLGRLCAGPLADPSRASAAYLAALDLDPSCNDAEMAVRAMHAGELPLVSDTPYAREDDGTGSLAAAATAWIQAAREGDDRAQASAIERVSTTASPAVKAVLLAVASERATAAGDNLAARRLAELAVHADHSSARAIATLADAIAGTESGRPAAAALERAVSLVGPRATWCANLAAELDALGELELAVGWTLRTVALRPGDRDSIEHLLDRILRSRQAGRLGDALTWLLSQPQPVSWLAEPFARGLRELAVLDVDRAAVIARRALDVLGPRVETIRAAMLEVASRAADASFEAALLERWIACGDESTDRAAALLRLADLRERLGDDEGRARVVARAAQEGVASPEIDTHLRHLGERTLGSDAELWVLRARAERTKDGHPTAAAWAWRDLGAALWDLAEDRVGAVEAWERAARLSPDRGHATLALDLVAFAGATFAFDYLAKLIEMEPEGAKAAVIAAEVARAALSTGEPYLAFDLAARGVARNPSYAPTLTVAERAADRTHESAALSGLYELVATRALGRFGRRAAHYRGARFFERRGEHALTLKHAAQAFYAVPSEGSAFQLLARAAVRAGDTQQAVRTVEQVAERSNRAEARAAWLLRAASIAGEGEEGARRRVDVLLRAAVAAPNVATVSLLRDAATDLLRHNPEERDGLEMRLGRAARTVTERVDGPEGARVALAFAATSLDLFSDADVALASVERAFACDADVEEFAALIPRGSTLALASDARSRAAGLLDAAEKPHTNVAVHVLRLVAAIAEGLEDEALRARAIVAAALRDPDDDGLVTEADAIVRNAPDLLDRLATRVSPGRRGQALLASARARVAEGHHADAATLLERAVDLCAAAERPEVERELRAAWEAAGKGGEIEARVQREAASTDASPTMRADRWTEIAERREVRGDPEGAVRALLEACKLDPEPMYRWSSLERVAEVAGDDEARVAALDELVTRVGHDGRVPVLKRLARAHERRGDLDAAVGAWGRILALDPDDEEADQAVETLIVARSRYDELVDHLARRAERLSTHTGLREVLRAVRLRRAAILEQRLGRVREACDELALLLAEWPENAGAIRYLADLLERQGEYAKSAPLWRRAAAIEGDPAERDDLELRAGRASLSSGDLEVAMGHATAVLARSPFNPDALRLRVELARALGADRDLGDALDVMAAGEGIDARTQTDLLLEASQASARVGDLQVARERAQRAANLSVDRAAVQLLVRSLEYRMRGPGAPDEARHTIEGLTQIREPLDSEDDALRAFLLAEALDVVQGGGAGMQELQATRNLVGDQPLVALGIAERLAGTGQPAAAVDAYRVALAGSLHDLRRIGVVAIAAADAAFHASRLEDAAHFLSIAEQHEDTREAAIARRNHLAQLESGTDAPSLPPEEALPIPLSTQRARAVIETPDASIVALEATVRTATTPGERARARLALGRRRLETGDRRGAEPLLWEALADGLAEAGDVLAPLVTATPDRTRDLVRIRRQQVVLEPGHLGRLESLRVAAIADEDRVFARAVEHVLRAFDLGAGPLPPPPLSAQPEQPGIFALLARPSMDVAGEALALLWEGAMQLFVRDPQSYGITGVERVVPGPSSVIARLYEASMRVLDAPRIPLFVPRTSSGAPLSHVAVLSPPSVILAGDVREESPEVRLALGRGMSSALTHNVLRLGLPPAEGRALVEAMRAAFGAPDIGRRVDARAARLAESFWQIVPARTQRRLQELLGGTVVAEYEELVARAHQSGRRVGLFLAGDFACAVRSLLAEAGARTEEPPSPTNLRRLCEQIPQLADLFRLAVSSEYASARWHVTAPASSHGTHPSGRFSLF